VDINNDGNPDIISGSWPGEIFLFQGTNNYSFAAPEMIKDKDGNFINIGGGIRKDTMFNPWDKKQPEGLLIAGYAKFDRTPEGTFVNYHGQRLESTPERPIAITGTASAAHAADWDGDGDYDLIIGTITGYVYLVQNEGTPESYSFGKEQQLKAGGNSIHVDRSAGPFTADWDGDGDLDLLVGADDGSVSLYCNTGDRKSPELASVIQLVPPVKDYSRDNPPKEVCRGRRSKICITDWNEDGLLDLLVGDISYQKPVLPEFTDEQKAEHTRLRNELEKVQGQYIALSKKLYGTDQKQTKEQIEKEQQEILNRMKELRSKLPAESECHGWVWLFLRKKI
jgi:hypothetical protein